MAIKEKFYLFKYGEQVSSGRLTEETVVEWEGELVLPDENSNPIGSIGPLEDGSEGKLAQVVINKKEFDRTKYQDELDVDKMYTPTENKDETIPRFKPSRVHLVLKEN